MATDCKDKIRKLLALAKSPVEAEAKAALLKARQLMAEHKLREEDCLEPEKLKVKKALVGITCTKRLNSWIAYLSAIIAENYCCTAWRSKRRGMQTVEIGFIGFEDDFEICERIFKYAVDCVLSRCKAIRKEYQDIYTGKHLGKMCDAYGFGFARGVAEAFERQTQKNQEWGLVLVIPQEVRDKASEMGKSTVFKQITAPEHISEVEAMREGYEDGQEFAPPKETCGRSANVTERQQARAITEACKGLPVKEICGRLRERRVNGYERACN